MRRSRRNAGPAAEVVRNICPGPAGAKDWNPSAFSPVTGLLYIPTLNICMDMGVVNANDVPGTPFVGADVRMYAGSGGNRGAFIAWDPVARRKVFEIREDLPLWSPALATAGGLVFYGTMKAIDAPDRQTPVAVQDGERDHRAAGELSRAGRAAICRGAIGYRRPGGGNCLGRPRPARPHGGARFRRSRYGSWSPTSGRFRARSARTRSAPGRIRCAARRPRPRWSASRSCRKAPGNDRPRGPSSATRRRSVQLCIRDPQHVTLGTAVPNLQVGERGARDINAFLYTRAE